MTTRTTAHRAVIDGLRDQLLSTYAGLGLGRRVAIVDAPLHDNVGDSLIWLGERHLLRALGISVIYAGDTHSFRDSDIARLPSDCAILIHGGGNLGDLWEDHQELRLRVLEQAADRRVVQLPQTANFRDPDKLEVARRAFSRHPDFHILCRDQTTLDLAAEINRGRALLCTDSALALRPRRRPEPGTRRPLLCRTDGEGLVADQPDDTIDWIGTDPGSRLDRAYRWAIGKYWRFSPHPGKDGIPPRLLARYIDGLCWLRQQYGIEVFDGTEGAIVDRLHAHILLMLLDVPHVVIDSGYGKLSSFMADWTGQSPLVALADDLPSARTALGEMLAGHPA